MKQFLIIAAWTALAAAFALMEWNLAFYFVALLSWALLRLNDELQEAKREIAMLKEDAAQTERQINGIYDSLSKL